MKLAVVRTHALSLPSVTEQPHFDHSSFRVRGKIFVTVPPDEEHIHIFVPEQDREKARMMHPEFLEKLLWGGKVVGLRATLPHADAAVIKRLVTRAWESKAPKSLLGCAQHAQGNAKGTGGSP